MPPYRLRILLGLTVSMALLAGPAWAGLPTDQMRAQIDQVIKTVENPDMKAKPNERRAVIRKIANETFDFPEMSRRALAKHWQERTPAERDEFVKLFADLLERAYVSRIEDYGG